MNEQFKAGGVRPWEITDTAIIYGGKTELPFSECTSINIVSTPTTALTQGVAQLVHNGKVYTLGFKFSDKARAHEAVAFAKDAISAAHGEVKDYKYKLLSHTGTYVEVYDTYLILYFMPVGSLMANLARGGTTGGKRLEFTTITSIQFKEPSGMSAGFIQFGYSGSIENNKGVVGAVNDENSIIFRADQLQLAKDIVNFVEKRRAELKASPTGVIVQQQISSADELLKYKQLLDMDAITQEEFNAKKAELLGTAVPTAIVADTEKEAEKTKLQEEAQKIAEAEALAAEMERQKAEAAAQEESRKAAELAEQKRLEAEKQLAEEMKKAAEAERIAQEEARRAAEAEALAKAEARKAAEAEAKLAKEQAELAKEQRLAKEREEAQRRKEENKKRAEQAKEQAKDTAQKVGKTAVKAGKTGSRVGLVILAVVFFVVAALLAISKFAFQAIEGFGVVIAIVVLAAIGVLLLKLSKTPKLK